MAQGSPQELADEFGLDYEPPHERYTPTYRREGDSHIIGFANAGLCFEISRLDIGKEIHGWVKATSTLPGTPPFLFDQRCNLSGPRGRQEMAKSIERRANVEASEIVERMCLSLLTAIREGEPVKRLSVVGDRPAALYLAHPIALSGMPVVLFGGGGQGKTTAASLIALAVNSGLDLCGLMVEPGPVLYLDWETDEYTVRDRFQAMARGFGITDGWDPLYRPCYAPLYEESESIARTVAQEGVVMAVIDHLGSACGGDKNSQEVTQRMFSAMRSWRCGVIGIDHIAKGSTDPTPFGSVYTTNLARSVWRVQGSQEEGSNVLHVGLFQTKTNVDKRQPPLGFRFTFDEDISCEREDVRDVTEMRGSLSASQQIKIALREAKQALTVTEIAEVTGLGETVARARLTDLVKRGDMVKVVIKGAANKYALRALDEE